MAPKKTENQSLGLVAPSAVPEPLALSSVNTPESSNTQDEGIYTNKGLMCDTHYLIF